MTPRTRRPRVLGGRPAEGRSIPQIERDDAARARWVTAGIERDIYHIPWWLRVLSWLRGDGRKEEEHDRDR